MGGRPYFARPDAPTDAPPSDRFSVLPRPPGRRHPPASSDTITFTRKRSRSGRRSVANSIERFNLSRRCKPDCGHDANLSIVMTCGLGREKSENGISPMPTTCRRPVLSSRGRGSCGSWAEGVHVDGPLAGRVDHRHTASADRQRAQGTVDDGGRAGGHARSGQASPSARVLGPDVLRERTPGDDPERGQGELQPFSWRGA